MKVKDPDGRTWRVTRRWVPWRRRLKDLDGFDLGPSFPDLGGMDDPVSVVIGIVVLVLCLPIIVLGIVAASEFFLLLTLLPFAVLARVVFGKAWTIEARRGYEIVWDAPAGDWQASGLRIHEVADAIRRGQTPPKTVG